ncbi:MAG: GxxExxY protein, partial [Bacteroidaceae bacterium]|nr:GxxExxY protein [Bacteroidaceae bacterium]
CAMEVYNTLGPGLLESAYEKALLHELHLNGLSAVSQKASNESLMDINQEATVL